MKYIFNTNKEYTEKIPCVSYMEIKSQNTKYKTTKKNMNETTSKLKHSNYGGSPLKNIFVKKPSYKVWQWEQETLVDLWAPSLIDNSVHILMKQKCIWNSYVYMVTIYPFWCIFSAD